MVSALGMTAVLGGCGVTGGSADVTLKLVAADYGDSKANSSQKYWDKLVEEYEAEHPGVQGRRQRLLLERCRPQGQGDGRRR